MACYRNLIFLSILFLTACAQVGTISGGPKDIHAPKPNFEKATPKNGTTNFQTNSIEIPFNEYFRLNNASQTIKMVPPHATVKATVKRKTLYLSWDESLEPNTTYAIYLNNSLKDITEGNDTIIQYVFSTGPVLDTLSYTGSLIDAWTNNPIDGCVVALYDIEKNDLVSFCESDALGKFQLKYLHEGTYRIEAFVDENNDLERQQHEKVGIPIEQSIVLNSAFKDSIPIRLFNEIGAPKITSKTFKAPGIYTIGANYELAKAEFYVNGSNVPSERISFISEDSVALFISPTDAQSQNVIVKTKDRTDTLMLRVTNEDRSTPLLINSSNKNKIFSPSEKISFHINDFITEIDTSKIELFNLSDSIIITDYSYSFHQNSVDFQLKKDSLHRVSFLFKKGAISSTHGTTDEQQQIIQLYPNEKYGIIQLDLSYYKTPIILHVLQNGKPYKTFPITSPSVTSLEELVPGDYSFKVVLDSNGNKKWDVGNVTTFRQPETVHFYTEKTNVRANWEVAVSLIPTE